LIPPESNWMSVFGISKSQLHIRHFRRKKERKKERKRIP